MASKTHPMADRGWSGLLGALGAERSARRRSMTSRETVRVKRGNMIHAGGRRGSGPPAAVANVRHESMSSSQCWGS